jgi:hypothetical protein
VSKRPRAAADAGLGEGEFHAVGRVRVACERVDDRAGLFLVLQP